MQVSEPKSRVPHALGVIAVVSLLFVGVVYREEGEFQIARATNILRSYRCSAGAYPAGPNKQKTGCVCLKCPAGKKCVGGSSPPRRCSRGTYQNLKGQNVCIPSPAGSYVPGYGASSPIKCHYGFFQNQRGQRRCKRAPPGTKVNRRGATSPTKCGRGRFQNRSGQRACKPAPPGTYVNSLGATRGTPCDYGKYQDQAGQTSCKNTPPGTYANRRGLRNPLPCNPNTFQHCAGQTTCIPCPIGTRQPSRGQRSCIAQGNVCPRFCRRACSPRPRRLQTKGEDNTEISVDGDSNLVVTASSVSTQLRKTSGCPVTAFKIVQTPARNQVVISGVLLPNCLLIAEAVFLYNAGNGKYEFNAVTRKVRSGNTYRLYLQRPARATYTQVVRAVYSSKNIVVKSQLTSNGFNGFTGGVLVVWSKRNVYIQGSLQMSGKGFRGGNVGANVGPENNMGRVQGTTGGGGGGCPGHGCGRTRGWLGNLVGKGASGGADPALAGPAVCVGGTGSAGGGGGGSGYGYDSGRGGTASNPGGVGGAKIGNSGRNGASATGPSGGGGGGGASRDNGGGGGGAKPVSTVPNGSNAGALFLGAGSASGGGGGGGGGAGDYKCSKGGNAGSALGRGGAAGTDTCSNRVRVSTNGQNGSNGSPGGGLIVVVAKNVLKIGSGSIMSIGGAGGNGGSGGVGGVTNCATFGGGGSGGGGGGAQGASGGTVVMTGASNVPVNVAGGRGGRGGAAGGGGGSHRGRAYGNGGNGYGGNNGFGGKVLRIGGASGLNVPSCNCNCR